MRNKNGPATAKIASVAEAVSPSSRKHGYALKMRLYEEAGIRKCWAVDPEAGRTTVYRHEATCPYLQE